jgi:hypothetical protein
MSRWDSAPSHCYGDDDESEEEGTASGHKAKPRRKSHQRPQVRIDVLKLSVGQNGSCSCVSVLNSVAICLSAPPLQGSDQIRQAFSKRKKGLVLKAYQLNSLTDAKVSIVERFSRTASSG